MSLKFLQAMTSILFLAYVYKSVLGHRRFGDPFRLSLFGRTVVVMNTFESIKIVLSTASETFAPQYPENTNVLMGLKSGKILKREYHQPFRKLVLAVGNPCGDKLSFINSRARETLDSWQRLGTVNTCDEITKVTAVPVLQCNESGKRPLHNLFPFSCVLEHSEMPDIMCLIGYYL